MQRRRFLSALPAALALPLAAPLLSSPDVVPALPTPQTLPVPKLQRGDTVALFAPASSINLPDAVGRTAAALREMGLKVVVGKSAQWIDPQLSYLAGTDEQRAQEFLTFWKNPQVKALVAIRGGYGSARLLEKLTDADFAMMQQNPKILIGFSDVTALHLALYQKAHLPSLHGPTAYSGWSAYNRQAVYDAVYQNKSYTYALPDANTTRNHKEWNPWVITSGKTQGILIGGNLTVFCSLIGSPFVPDAASFWQDKILFLEEVGEDPYKIDRMLTQLRWAKILTSVRGILMGQLRKSISLTSPTDEPEAIPESIAAISDDEKLLRAVLQDRLGDLQIPVVAGMPFGHTPHNAALPIGAVASLQATAHTTQKTKKTQKTQKERVLLNIERGIVA